MHAAGALKTLAGRTALVTGASGGIGRAICEELARRGARIVATGRSASRLATLHSSLSQIQPTLEHQTIECDLLEASGSEIKNLAKNSVDILVNAAGISRDGLLLRQKKEDVVDMMQVNLVSCMEVCKQVSQGMVRRRSGCIVNVSSVIGLHGNTGQSAYAATKAGMIGFTKSLARELGPRGIRVNAIAPGFIDTELTRSILEQPVTKSLVARIPLQAVGSVDDVAHGAAFLAENRYITGQVLVIDGGLFI
ncbi:hypothetical protein GGI15_004496 [Coemansia interrupta]|uniref:3-oxoacyl-[acyl-carrier-protein] reductase n=1 Tax=Coemansia interrupta TaxID=1126814 RepID=A0A9W8H437_9FUNG|nr:hypothetical protein GGI15_004496 [Coemansia interrupta]